MRWAREKYIELMSFGRVERPMFVEIFGLLVGVEDEWRAQGACKNEIDLSKFDFDYVQETGCGGYTGIIGKNISDIIEETPEYIIKTDELGRNMKLYKGNATIALPLNYPVKDMNSWLKIKHLYEFNEGRIKVDEVEKAIELQKKGALVTASIPGGFDTPRQLMGEEECCISYYKQPELIKDIMETIEETSFKVLDIISSKLTIDELRVHEDMAGNTGPLIGPKQVEEFIKPYYSRIWKLVSSRGTRLFNQDSDGNMNPVIDAFIEGGINIMSPVESNAGMDMVSIRKKYGRRLAFVGGIDKFVLRQDKESIRRELEYKLQPVMTQGGTAFGLDHRILNGISIKNYKYYVETVRNIIGLAKIG